MDNIIHNLQLILFETLFYIFVMNIIVIPYYFKQKTMRDVYTLFIITQLFVLPLMIWVYIWNIDFEDIISNDNWYKLLYLLN